MFVLLRYSDTECGSVFVRKHEVPGSNDEDVPGLQHRLRELFRPSGDELCQLCIGRLCADGRIVHVLQQLLPRHGDMQSLPSDLPSMRESVVLLYLQGD